MPSRIQPISDRKNAGIAVSYLEQLARAGAIDSGCLQGVEVMQLIAMEIWKRWCWMQGSARWPRVRVGKWGQSFLQYGEALFTVRVDMLLDKQRRPEAV